MSYCDLSCEHMLRAAGMNCMCVCVYMCVCVNMCIYIYTRTTARASRALRFFLGMSEALLKLKESSRVHKHFDLFRNPSQGAALGFVMPFWSLELGANLLLGV